MISETIETDTKRCRKCGESKPKSEFHKDPSKADGVMSRCGTCANAIRRAKHLADPTNRRASSKAWQRANPAKYRDALLRTKYGISLQTRDAIFDAQDRRCIITQAADPGSRQRWATDHCHDGGFVRGVITPAANVALGQLKDDPLNFASAMIYLAVNGKRLTPAEWSDFCAVYSPLCIQ